MSKSIYKTWGLKHDAGTWSLAFVLDFSILCNKEVNDWYISAFSRTVDSFSSLSRVSTVSFTSHHTEQSQPMMIRWNPELSYQKYINKVIESIASYSAPIEILEMYLDLQVYINTEQYLNKPVLEFVDYLGKITICGGKKYGNPYLYFEIEHTLFCPYSYSGEDNRVLYALNQPLLEKALKSWEQEFNVEIEAEGLPGIYKYGFLPHS